MEGPVHHRPMGKGQGQLGTPEAPALRAAHIHENRHGTSYCHSVWVTENINHKLFPQT